MKYAHNIELRVFCKEGEDEELIKNKLKELIPLDFNKEKINIREQTALGLEDKKIKKLTIFVDKEKQTSKVLLNLMGNLNEEQKELILNQLESRVDRNLHFYLRLDKDKLLNNEYWITDSGNCFHFSIAVAAYPHKREVARKIIEKVLKN